MTLVAWPQIAPAGDLRLWIGLFGNETPALPTFQIDGTDAQALAPVVWHPIRDRRLGPGGRPVNHQTVVRLKAKGPDTTHRVRIRAGNAEIERTILTPPAQVPAKLAGTFNILLSSCYFQPNDGSGLLGDIVSRLPVKPHMTVLAGDQVYLDLPLFEDLPEDEDGLAQAIGDKYRKNWMSSELRIAGLQSVLSKAPAVCIPDDHEFWNNFPFRQVQLPGTWTQEGRKRWQLAAQALYEDYQQGGAPGTAPTQWRFDIAPLSILLLDTRVHRRADLDAADGLMDAAAAQAVKTWESDLIASTQTGSPQIGVLFGGQALFVDKPSTNDAKVKDAEYANYVQFNSVVEAAIIRLVDAGVPVLFVTGDVHWGRITETVHLPTGRTLLYEVICSPSRLIDTPGADGIALFKDAVTGLFGTRATWPRHAKAPDPPARFGVNRQFQTQALDRQQGDQVALLQFSRSGTGVELQVTYYPIHNDPVVAQPRTTLPCKLSPA